MRKLASDRGDPPRQHSNQRCRGPDPRGRHLRLGWKLGEKWTWDSAIRYGELSQPYVSPGIHYLITPNFEAGVRVGWGVSDDAANFSSNVGIGLRY